MKLDLVATEKTSNQQVCEKTLLLNRFNLIAIVFAFIAVIVFAIDDDSLMFNITMIGGAFCLLTYIVTAVWGYKLGWHLGMILSITFLISQALYIKSIFAISLMLCSFILIVNYIFLKSRIRFFYYLFITIGVIIVLINPVLSISIEIVDTYKLNLIYGIVGILLQISFSMFYSQQAMIKDKAISKKEKEINQLLIELKEQNRNLEGIVSKRTLSLNKLNEELKRSNLDLNHFACSASHDLKEPLRTIASFLKILEKRSGDKIDAEGREYLNYAVDGAKRMSNLINDLLEYSQVGTRSAQVRPCDFKSILERKLLDLNQKINEKKAIVIYDELPNTISCIPNQMSILIYNLINNALKFNESEQPTIIVKGKERKGDWLIAVADNGIGILEKDREKIFEVFNRLHTKAQYEGSGIGLAICKKIVSRHQGKIWLESTENKGTTFFFTIKKVPVAVEMERVVA